MKHFLTFFVLFANVGFLPYLTQSIFISKPSELTQLFNTSRSTVDDEIELLGDLDFSGTKLEAPLGTRSKDGCVKFRGILHGNGYSIKGLVMGNTENLERTDAGLFCNLENAKIENIMIDDSCFFAGQFCGVLSVNATGSLTLINVTNKGNAKGVLGVGIIGQVNSPELSGVMVFDNCVNEGNISANFKVGGFIGLVFDSEHVDIQFVNTKSQGFINGTGMCTGGFIGSVYLNRVIRITKLYK